MMRCDKPLVDVLELCSSAGDLLRQVGFVVREVSRQSEATYYSLPGFPQTLRVAAHPKGSDGWAPPVVGSLTFIADRKTPGQMRISQDQLRDQVARAIGRYLLTVSNAP